MPLSPSLPYTGAAFIALWMVACCSCVSLPAGEAATCRRSRRNPPQLRRREERDTVSSSSCSGVVWSAAVTLSAASLVAQAGAQLLYALGVIGDEGAPLPSWVSLLGLMRRYSLLQMLLVSIGGLGLRSLGVIYGDTLMVVHTSGPHTLIRPAVDAFALTCVSTPCSSCVAPLLPACLANPAPLLRPPPILLPPCALRRWRPP